MKRRLDDWIPPRWGWAAIIAAGFVVLTPKGFSGG